MRISFGLQRRHEQPVEKLVDGDDPLAVGPVGNHFGTYGQHRGRVIVGGVAVGDVAAHRGAVANDGIGDHRRGVEQNGVALGNHIVVLQRCLADQRADFQVAVFFDDLVECRDVADVDDVAGLRQPQLHHGQQTVAARHHLGLVAQLGEQLDGGIEAAGSVVVELRRNHLKPPLALVS